MNGGRTLSDWAINLQITFLVKLNKKKQSQHKCTESAPELTVPAQKGAAG